MERCDLLVERKLKNKIIKHEKKSEYGAKWKDFSLNIGMVGEVFGTLLRNTHFVA